MVLSASSENTDGGAIHVSDGVGTEQTPRDSIPASLPTFDLVLHLNSSSHHVVRVSVQGSQPMPAGYTDNKSGLATTPRGTIVSPPGTCDSDPSPALDAALPANVAHTHRDNHPLVPAALSQVSEPTASAARSDGTFSRLHASIMAYSAVYQQNAFSGISPVKFCSLVDSHTSTLVAKVRKCAANRTDRERPWSFPLMSAHFTEADNAASVQRQEIRLHNGAQGQMIKSVRKATRFSTDEESEVEKSLYLTCTHACHHCCDSDKEGSCDRTLGCQECRAQGMKCEYNSHGLYTISLDCSLKEVPRFTHDILSFLRVNTACKECESASQVCYSIDKACKSCVEHKVVGCKYDVGVGGLVIEGLEVSYDVCE